MWLGEGVEGFAFNFIKTFVFLHIIYTTLCHLFQLTRFCAEHSWWKVVELEMMRCGMVIHLFPLDFCASLWLYVVWKVNEEQLMEQCTTSITHFSVRIGKL